MAEEVAQSRLPMNGGEVYRQHCPELERSFVTAGLLHPDDLLTDGETALLFQVDPLVGGTPGSCFLP